MVEYAVLIAHMGAGTLGTFARSAELWLSRVNWELVGYVGLVLIGLWIVTWPLRHR